MKFVAFVPKYKRFNVLTLKSELVAQSQLEGEVLAVEVVVIENLRATKGVAGIEHKVLELVRQANGNGKVEALDVVQVD